MHRQRPWLVSLVLTITSLAVVYATGAGAGLHGVTAALLAITGWVAAAGFLTGLAGTVVYGLRAWRQHRRDVHAQTAAAVAARRTRAQTAAQEGWRVACDLMHQLAAGRPPVPITVWGLVLRPGERAYLTLPATYSRFYGGDGRYVHVNGVFVGSPSFVAAGAALTAMGNRSRRNAAMAAAAHQWREHQMTQVVLTSQRLICNVTGRWMSFGYGGVTAFYPEPLSLDAPVRFVGRFG